MCTGCWKSKTRLIRKVHKNLSFCNRISKTSSSSAAVTMRLLWFPLEGEVFEQEDFNLWYFKRLFFSYFAGSSPETHGCWNQHLVHVGNHVRSRGIINPVWKRINKYFLVQIRCRICQSLNWVWTSFVRLCSQILRSAGFRRQNSQDIFLNSSMWENDYILLADCQIRVHFITEKRKRNSMKRLKFLLIEKQSYALRQHNFQITVLM